MEIKNELLLRQALRDGFNLFLGAGFSVLARNQQGRAMPLGHQLGSLLRNQFRLGSLPEALSLPNLVAIIKRSDREEFRRYINELYTVAEADSAYQALISVSCQNVFTTNVDDLVQVIYEATPDKYIRDCFINGPTANAPRAVNFFALHGNVRHPGRELIFSSTETASAFADDPRLWNHFSHLVTQNPTLFWGYSLNDAAPLQAIHSQMRPGTAPVADRWILIHPSEQTNRTLYEALGFFPIIGTTDELLAFIGGIDKPAAVSDRAEVLDTTQLFPEFAVPSFLKSYVRKLDDYFLGAEPEWIDIYQSGPAETRHLTAARELVASGRHLLMKGIPFSGKTTLLKMLAVKHPPDKGHVLYLDYLDAAEAAVLVSRLNGARATIFWDNIFDSLAAAEIIQNHPNIQIVATDRDTIFQTAFHRLKLQDFNVYDVTDLSPEDVQKIRERIPLHLRRTRTSLPRETAEPSVFEVVEAFTRVDPVARRVANMFAEIEHGDPLLAELVVLFAYMRATHVPVSMDLAIAYAGAHGADIGDTIQKIEAMGKLKIDYEGIYAVEQQDYFYSRSQVFAERAVEDCPSRLLRSVLEICHRDISIVKIPNYDVFQRRAFNNEMFFRAFPDWRAGKALYEHAYSRELDRGKNPYIMQQCALYLSRKGQHNEAFLAIEEALRASRRPIFSIRNTHAEVIFEANIVNSEEYREEEIRASLFDSMTILNQCHQDDRRKLNHAIKHGRFAVRLFDRYGDEECKATLKTAKTWLQEELTRDPHSRGARMVLKNVLDRLGSLCE